MLAPGLHSSKSASNACEQDQVWFAYTGLKAYGLHDLAENIKGRTLSKGRGFQAGDSTPLNEHCRFFARV